MKAAEKSLFSTAPWNRTPQNRRGSTALKTYLGHVLSSKIRDCFPELCSDIESTLNLKLAEKQSLGEPRETSFAKRQYLMATVNKFEELAKSALDRPEDLPGAVTPLLWQVKELDQCLDDFMRAMGGKWDFEDADVDPFAKIAEALGQEPGLSLTPQVARKVSASLEKKYTDCSSVQDPEDLMKTIGEQLTRYQAAQLPGIVNPVVYRNMYQMQVEKWETITHEHLLLVGHAVQHCYISILDFIFPSHGEPNILRDELENILRGRLDASYQVAEAQRMEACQSKTKCKLLHTTDPKFGEQVLGWRQLRFFQATRAAQIHDLSDVAHLSTFINYFQLAHPSLEKNMIHDVHDVLKVYYKVWFSGF